jgi:NAD(P)-dependent dehydrogenase (short-subunit alcohol dehydrogenase family)
MGRFQDRVVLVVGAGQTPGVTIGNGKASALLYAREGGKVFAVDNRLEAAAQTAEDIVKEGGTAVAHQTDATDQEQVAAMVEACMKEWGRIDVLHNNVGVSIAAGDAPLTELDGDVFDRVMAINLKSQFLTLKYVIPVMREQLSGSIVNMSSLAAVVEYPNTAYKLAKAGVNAFTQQQAIMNAQYGIRVNAIMPGQVNTPMIVENRIGKDGMTREDVMAMFDSIVPLRGKMGSAWDIAKAAAFLASDDAGFITGVILTVDGGQGLHVGGQGLRSN